MLEFFTNFFGDFDSDTQILSTSKVFSTDTKTAAHKVGGGRGHWASIRGLGGRLLFLDTSITSKLTFYIRYFLVYHVYGGLHGLCGPLLFSF